MKERRVIGCVLTGGENRRMNGKIKLYLPWRRESFLQEVLAALEDLPEVVLSVRDPEPYRNTGLPLIEDEIQGIGPVGGILSVLHQTDVDAVLVVASDMPEINTDVIQRLLDAYRRNPVTTLYRDGDYMHPFPGIYGRDCLQAMEQRVEEGCYKVQAVLRDSPHQLLWVKGDELFLENVNTPEDYRKLLERTAGVPAENRELS